MTAELFRMRTTENLTSIPCHRSILAAVDPRPGRLYWQIGRAIVQQHGAKECPASKDVAQ